ncbi:MAG: D-alanine--D-alanine ligase [Pseudomonadota bacterium]
MDVLHLAGATTTRFYHDLSLTYRRHCVAPPGTRAASLDVAPDGTLSWDGTPVPLSVALHRAAAMDVVVPHMFCPAGMTAWRDLFETVVGVPVVGPSVSTLTTATSKSLTKALAGTVGVRSPAGHRLTAGALAPDIPVPCIVKPDGEDNSLGLTLVRDRADLAAALGCALQADRVALAEEYIPGREVRVGVIDDGRGPRVLPILEYHVTAERPIRQRADKVDLDEDGAVTMKAWQEPSLDTSCPADLSPNLRAELARFALAMHDALNCRDYSLYDFRIHAGTGAAYLLEACIFWTFTPISVISRMLAAEGTDLETAALRMWRRAAERKGAAPAGQPPLAAE